jgi:hypothetical protein
MTGGAIGMADGADITDYDYAGVTDGTIGMADRAITADMTDGQSA